MRVLMVGHYPPHKGGVAKHLENLVKELRGRHEVHVLTYGPVKPREFEKDFVHHVRVPPVYGIRGTSFALLASRKIVELHREFGFDVVHAHFVGTTSFSGVIAKEKTGLPLVVTAHGSDLEHTSKLPLGSFYVKKSLESANAVIAVSHYLAARAIALGAKSVKVIPNGLGHLKKKTGKREFITFIGALRDYKAPEDFIELARNFPELKFLVVGEGPLKKSLEKIAPENVSLLGYREDVDDILSKSILLVLPSKREGFGLVVIEANYLGVPVIGRRISAIPELIREGKNGMTFESFEELVEKTNKLLERKVNRKLGHTGEKVAEKFTWRNVAERVEEVYLSVVKS